MSELPPRGPRHAREEEPPRSPSEAPVPPEVRERWEAGTARFGNAFGAYLALSDINPSDPEILDNFTFHFFASYPDMRTCVESFVESLGWQSALDELEREHMDIQGFLAWDYELIEEHIREMYEPVEFGGQLHLFDR